MTLIIIIFAIVSITSLLFRCYLVLCLFTNFWGILKICNLNRILYTVKMVYTIGPVVYCYFFIDHKRLSYWAKIFLFFGCLCLGFIHTPVLISLILTKAYCQNVPEKTFEEAFKEAWDGWPLWDRCMAAFWLCVGTAASARLIYVYNRDGWPWPFSIVFGGPPVVEKEPFVEGGKYDVPGVGGGNLVMDFSLCTQGTHEEHTDSMVTEDGVRRMSQVSLKHPEPKEPTHTLPYSKLVRTPYFYERQFGWTHFLRLIPPLEEKVIQSNCIFNNDPPDPNISKPMIGPQPVFLKYEFLTDRGEKSIYNVIYDEFAEEKSKGPFAPRISEGCQTPPPQRRYDYGTFPTGWHKEFNQCSWDFKPVERHVYDLLPEVPEGPGERIIIPRPWESEKDNPPRVFTFHSEDEPYAELLNWIPSISNSIMPVKGWNPTHHPVYPTLPDFWTDPRNWRTAPPCPYKPPEPEQEQGFFQWLCSFFW